jgi:hypothetical protein
VELHGGRISAQSAGLGRGSEFIVTFPRSRNAKPLSTSQGNAQAAPAKLETRSRRVLVIDDNVDAALSL